MLRARIALVVAASVAGSLVMWRSAEPAGATQVTLSLSCQSSTPIGAIATSQTISFDAAAPAGVQPQDTFAVNLTFPASTVSSSQNGGAAHVDYIKDLSYRIDVPQNSQYVSGSLSGGFNYGAGTPTVTLQGSSTSGSIRYAIPGPIDTDEEFQIPALRVNLKATGASGSTIVTQLAGSSLANPGFTTTAHVTSPFNGDAATSCFEPAPKTIWTTTNIIMNDTTPPVITLATPAEGGQYPQGASVSVSYSCNDGPLSSGVASCAGDLPNGAALDTSQLGTFSFTVAAADNAGNVSTPVTHTYSIVAGGNDAVPPAIAITSPADGAVVAQDAAVAADFACSDSESGIATCDGDVADGSNIDTATIGGHSFTVVATDLEGNPHAVVHSYRVVPNPTQQNFTSGDVSNQIPVVCDNQFQTAHKTIPVAGNLAPVSVAMGGQYQWTMTLGADFIPTLSNGTNLLYEFAAPTNAHFVSAALTGTGSQVNGTSISIAGNGRLQLRITSVTDQGTAGVGNDAFTPPPFRAVVAADGPAGTVATIRFSEFQVTTTPVGLPVPTTSRCTAGDPTFNGRTNPALTNTSISDATPPTIAIASPVHGASVKPNAAVTFDYSCSDDRVIATCIGTSPTGTTLDTSSSGPVQVAVFATDTAGNISAEFVTFVVEDPTVDVADASVLEGPGATIDFDVTLSNPTEKPISVAYSTADGTATAPADYTATSGVLNFAPGGATSLTVSVPVADDDQFLPGRLFTLELISATNAVLGDTSAVGTIIDDDPPPVVVSSPKVGEATGQIDFTLTLVADPLVPVTVDYATENGTASSPARFTATNGSHVFTPGGPLVHHVIVPLVNDAVYNETSPMNTQSFDLRAVEPANGYTATGTGTIVDDEVSPVFASIGSIQAREGDIGTRAVTVGITLSKPATSVVTVTYQSVSLSASANGDFKSVLRTVSFQPGQLFKPATVRTYGDATPESDEVLLLRLTQSTARIWRNEGRVTLLDDDRPTATAAQFEISDAQMYEGTGTKATILKFTVSLNRPSSGPVSVRYSTMPGSASAGVDFKPKSGTLQFTGTQVVKTVSITVTADSLIEGDDFFTVLLSSPSGAPVTITKSAGIGTVLNDD